MNQSLSQWIQEAQAMQFPYCDAAHEDYDRPALTTDHRLLVLPQCDESETKRLPACLHNADLFLEKFHRFLIRTKILTDDHPLYAQHLRDERKKPSLDREIRAARLGTRLTDPGNFIPNREESEQRAAPLIDEYRAMINRMSTFRDQLLAVAMQTVP